MSTHTALVPHRIQQPQERTFTCFSRLPAELRLQIWEDTFKPKRVHMSFEEVGTVHPNNLPQLALRCTIGCLGDHAPQPIALSVCQESRVFALVFYRDILIEKADNITQHPDLRRKNGRGWDSIKFKGFSELKVNTSFDTLMISGYL